MNIAAEEDVDTNNTWLLYVELFSQEYMVSESMRHRIYTTSMKYWHPSSKSPKLFWAFNRRSERNIIPVSCLYCCNCNCTSYTKSHPSARSIPFPLPWIQVVEVSLSKYANHKKEALQELAEQRSADNSRWKQTWMCILISLVQRSIEKPCEVLTTVTG